MVAVHVLIAQVVNVLVSPMSYVLQHIYFRYQ